MVHVPFASQGRKPSLCREKNMTEPIVYDLDTNGSGERTPEIPGDTFTDVDRDEVIVAPSSCFGLQSTVADFSVDDIIRVVKEFFFAHARVRQ